MAIWQQILLAILAVIVLFLFLPGVRRAHKEAPKGSRSDWQNMALVAATVIGFVLLLILLARL